MSEEQIKHLEFIQDTITRMNANSFQIKGWCITILTALLAIYASNTNVLFLFISIIPTFLFWILDAYYLQQERKFRGIYNDVIKEESNIKLFMMPLNRYTKGKYSFWSSFTSITIAGLYGTIIALLVLGSLLPTLITAFSCSTPQL